MMHVKSGDTHEVEWRVESEVSGVPQNLTGCTVRLLVRKQYDDTLVTLPATVDDAVGGIVAHQLSGTLEVGKHLVEIEVTGPTGEITTAPTKAQGVLVVEEDLG